VTFVNCVTVKERGNLVGLEVKKCFRSHRDLNPGCSDQTESHNHFTFINWGIGNIYFASAESFSFQKSSQALSASSP